MHEFSMAQMAVSRILEIARENKAKRISSVKFVIGDLTFLNIDQLRFSIELLSKGTMMEGCELSFERERLRIRCRNCGFEGETKYEGEEYHTPKILELTLSLKCPKCGSLDVDILSGRAFLIKSVRMVV